MPIVPLTKHYSMENVVTVYDEEAMTPLELAARTAAKTNECVDTINKFEQDAAAFRDQVQAEIPQQIKDNLQDLIEDGSFDKAIADHTGDLAARVDSIVSNAGNDNTEVVDIRTGADRNIYPTAGQAVRDQFRVMAHGIANGPLKVFDQFVDGSFYSATGDVIGSTNYKRSAYLLPCGAGQIFRAEIEHLAANTVWLACYDKNMKFLSTCKINGHTINEAATISATPPNTAFIGLTVYTANGQNDFDALTLAPLETVKDQLIKYPFDGEGSSYFIWDNLWVNSAGSFSASESYFVAVFKTEGIKSLYVNSTVLYNGIFFDANNTLITNGAEYETHGIGRTYAVPDNAAWCILNMPKNYSSGDVLEDTDGNPTAYAAFTFDRSEKLNGKKILFIGDSLPYLDGRSVDGRIMVGMQAYTRAMGATVDTIAFSGMPIATVGETTGIVETIFADIDLEKSLKEYDAVVIFAGRNDMRLGYDLQLWTDIGGDKEILAGTTCGELADLINGIDGAVFVCTPLWSTIGTSSVSFEKVLELRDYMVETCRQYGATLIDTTLESGINTNTLATFTYDGVHPSFAGMARIGKLIARKINEVIGG